MSILTSASSTSVGRGYDYYLKGNVLSCERIGEDEYEGYVRGNGKEPYHVILNVKHPRKSECDCPHANGTNIVCKHIVAMYFYLFPEEANEYGDWLNSDFFDEDFYEQEYDEYGSRHNYFESTLPFCYDELLEEYINSFSLKELQSFMRDRLNENKNYTYNNLLRTRYDEYIKKHGNDVAKIDELNSKLNEISQISDYDYYNFNEKILTEKEKRFIKESYINNKQLLEKTLLNPSLGVFLDYIWVIKFIRNKIDKQTKEEYTKKLNNLFNSLKHYGIRNTMPKSNVLICLYELNDYAIDDLAKSLIKNVKYIDYVRYVIDRVDDANSLYESIKCQIKKVSGFNYHEIPDLFLEFHDRFSEDINLQERILLDHSYYNFLYNNNYQSLNFIYKTNNKVYIEKIKENVHKNELIMSICCIEENYDKLYEIVKKENKEYYYDKYIEYLAIKYSDELFERYRKNVLEILEEGMGRDIYYKAACQLGRIRKLENGEEKIEKIINELKNSKHSKKTALFDEIKQELKRKY